MSPRSEEFFEQARQRLPAARSNLRDGFDFTATHEAYYAMLFAARAALSEKDLYAKTHAGTWALFHKTFVRDAGFPTELSGPVDEIRKLREQADYGAINPTSEQAADAVEHAVRYVDAIERMLG